MSCIRDDATLNAQNTAQSATLRMYLVIAFFPTVFSRPERTVVSQGTEVFCGYLGDAIRPRQIAIKLF